MKALAAAFEAGKAFGDINNARDRIHSGESIRSVVEY